MNPEEFNSESAEAEDPRRWRVWKIWGWVLASPFILFISRAIVVPAIVSSYYALSAHPDNIHGDHPDEYAGLFVSEDAENDDQFAIALRPDDRTDISRGWGQTYWHVKGETLYLDSFPSNCTGFMPLRFVNEYDFEMVGPDKMILRFGRGRSRFDGTYTLVRKGVNQELWDELEQLETKNGERVFSTRAFRIWVALKDAGIYEEEPTSWDGLEATSDQ